MQRQMSSGFLRSNQLHVPDSNGSVWGWNVKSLFSHQKIDKPSDFDGLIYDHGAES